MKQIIFCIAICALAATQTAWAANYEFTGEVDNNWSTAGNWRIAYGGNQQTSVPSDSNQNFWPSTKMPQSFADNPVVEIDGTYGTTYKLHVRNLGTESNPVVFRADTDDHGVTAAGANTDKGFFIGYDVGNAWLRLEKGTYTGGTWFIGSSDYIGNIVVCDGVTMSGYQIRFGNGSFSATNTALTVNNTCYFGYQSGKSVTVYKNEGAWTMKGNMHVGHNGGGTLVQDGGAIEVQGNLFIGNPGEGSLTINSGALNGKTTYIGRNGAIGRGTLTVNGGTVSLVGDCVLGDKGDTTDGGTGTLIVNGGTMEIDNTKCTRSGNGTGTINLNGGTFKTKYCRDDVAGGSFTINFNGGTLQANAVQSNGLLQHGSGNGLYVYVGANGGTIHTGGLGISIPVAINDASGASGAMTFAGGGNVTLSGAVGWTGGTTITNSTVLSVTSDDNVACILTNGLSVAIPAGGVPVGTVVLAFTGVGTIDPAWLGANDVVSGDAADIADLYLGCSSDGKSVVVKSSAIRPLTWIGNENDNWTDSGKWDDGNGPTAWENGSKAIFNTPSAVAVVDAAVTAHETVFRANATVGGTGNLTAETVVVSNGVSAAINAPTAGALAKTGGGTLVLGANRTERTVVSEGTLAMSGATVDSSKLTLGTYAKKPVVFDYGGQTLSGKWKDYLAAGMDITLTNGTFSTPNNPGWWVTTMPKSLTIAKDAVMTSSDRLTWNMCGSSDADATNYVNIVGGALVSTQTGQARNWLMQDSRRGTLVFNVSDGGLLEFANRTYLLSCRDNTTANDTPGLLLTFNDSTFRVNNNSLLIGYNDDNLRKNPREPIFELAMTNSVLDVGKGSIYLGHNERQSNTAGHATADFENCVVTAKQFGVYMDRPANGARFNNSTLVLTADNNGAGSGDGWILATNDAPVIVIGPGGLVLDSQGYNGNVRADFGGTGAVTKKGSGKIAFFRSQTAAAAFVCEEGETFFDAGLSVSRPVTMKSDTKLTTKGTNQVSFAGLTLEAGTTLNIDSPTFGVPSMAVGALALPTSGSATLTINGGTPAMGRYAIFEKEGIAIADVQDKLVPSAGTWEVSDNTLYLVVKGENDVLWTGMGDGESLDSGENWLGGLVPSSEQNAVIGVSNGVTLVCDGDFSPGSITFAADSVAATISGAGSISGVTSITNLSAVSHTINVPVYFVGNIQVTQNADYYDRISRSHIVFAGGAYPAAGKSIETGATVNWSRCMFGDYYLDSAATARWTATQHSNCRPALADNSTLHVPYAGNLKEMNIGGNATMFVGDIELGNGGARLSHVNNGEMVVTNLTLTGAADDRFATYGQGTSVAGVFKLNCVTNAMTGKWFYLGDANVAAKHVFYIGEGGLNFSSFAKSSYCLGRNTPGNYETIRPWYSDFTIADRGDGAFCFVMMKDVEFCTDDENGTGRTVTIDAVTRSHVADTTITVSGSGTLKVNKTCESNTANANSEPTVTVTNTATLALKPGVSHTLSNVTVNAGATLAVSESGRFELGCDFVLRDSACLGFNYTNSEAPVLDLTGNDVTFDEGVTTNVVVKISAENGARAKYNGGRNVLTAGQKFAGVNVTLDDGPGRPEWVIDVKEEDGEIVAYIKSIGLMLFVR